MWNSAVTSPSPYPFPHLFQTTHSILAPQLLSWFLPLKISLPCSRVSYMFNHTCVLFFIWLLESAGIRHGHWRMLYSSTYLSVRQESSDWYPGLSVLQLSHSSVKCYVTVTLICISLMLMKLNTDVLIGHWENLVCETPFAWLQFLSASLLLVQNCLLVSGLWTHTPMPSFTRDEPRAFWVLCHSAIPAAPCYLLTYFVVLGTGFSTLPLSCITRLFYCILFLFYEISFFFLASGLVRGRQTLCHWVYLPLETRVH